MWDLSQFVASQSIVPNMYGLIMAVEILRLNLPPRPPINSSFANQVDGFLQTIAGEENHLVSTAIFRRSHDFVMKDNEDFHEAINWLRKLVVLRIRHGRFEISTNG